MLEWQERTEDLETVVESVGVVQVARLAEFRVSRLPPRELVLDALNKPSG